MNELPIYKLIKQHDRCCGTFLERHYCLTALIASIAAASFLTALAMFVLLAVAQSTEQWSLITLSVSVLLTLFFGLILFDADWTKPESLVHDELLRSIASSCAVSAEFKSSLRLALSQSDNALITRRELITLIDEEQTRLDTTRRESGPGYRAIMAARGNGMWDPGCDNSSSGTMEPHRPQPVR